jgi:hypothetical protein
MVSQRLTSSFELKIVATLEDRFSNLWVRLSPALLLGLGGNCLWPCVSEEKVKRNESGALETRAAEVAVAGR